MNTETVIPTRVTSTEVRSDTRPKAAIIFNRLGPYHHARLNAAGKLMRAWGVEACATEGTYAWSKVEGAERFIRVTLTEYDSGDRQWRGELRNKMWRALDGIGPHIVVVPGWAAPEALAALLWCQARKTPAVVMSESTAWDETRVVWKEWIKSRLVKLCSAGLVGGTPHAEYLAKLGLRRERIFLGYDIVDNDYFAAKCAECKTQSTIVRKQLALPEKYFLASARFVEKKNLFRLIEAYAYYRNFVGSSGAWHLVLLGDGPLKEKIAAKLAALDLQSHVSLPGFIQYEKLPAYYALASTFIHASTTEQWGLVVNEAMASGLPVLVSNRCGCAHDLVQENVNGFKFDPDNTEALATLMGKISEPCFPLSQFGAESSRVIASWGPDRFGTGLRGAIETAQREPRPRAAMIDSLLLRLLSSRQF